MPLLQNLYIWITGAMTSRLTRTPHRYSTPLRKALRGYWKLRVGDYRIVYKIEGEEVWVPGINIARRCMRISYRDWVKCINVHMHD